MEETRFYAFAVFQALVVTAFLVKMLTLGRPWDAQRMVGTVLLVTGMGLVATARIQLGRSFSVRARAQKLVTHGLYSRIRNPVYVFGTVVLAGMILILREPRLWFLLGALIVVQAARARREAVVLEAAFGDAYREYKSRTWF